MTTRLLPKQFSALESFVADWALPTEAERLAKLTRTSIVDLKAFYDANAALFKTPEEVNFEYVILTPDALSAEVAVTADEVKAQYAAQSKQFTQEEQRQAAHVLIAVKPDAPAADKAAAKKKAEDIFTQAKANPAKFAELAKQYSQDPGSAAQGGELGSNPRGTMVKAFDDAVFAAKPGDIVGPVETKLTGQLWGVNVLPLAFEPGGLTITLVPNSWYWPRSPSR